MNNERMKQPDDERRVRPGFFALGAGMIAVALMLLWLHQTKPSPSVGTVEPATVEAAGTLEPSPPPTVGTVETVAADPAGQVGAPVQARQPKYSPRFRITEPAALQASGAIEPNAPSSDGTAGPVVADPAGPVGSPADARDTAYQERVGQVVEKMYADMPIADPTENTSASTAGSAPTPDVMASTNLPLSGGGVGSHQATDRAKRALIQQLIPLRRAAIAQANQGATNR